MNVTEKYIDFCNKRSVPFALCDKINPYDDTTLFCPAGMQQYKSLFLNESYLGTKANIQSCIRLNDLSEIGDGTHLLYFNMIGLFSFREMTVESAIDFWMGFLKELNLRPDYVTIHPDRTDWMQYYENMEIKLDNECKWSDGVIGGYCTEFYINGIEIGNIVNPLGTCIDVGFGLERIQYILDGVIKPKEDILKESILKIIESGYKPSNVKQGYVLRKLLRNLSKMGMELDHPFFKEEQDRQKAILKRYEGLRAKNPNKSKAWWFDTHGIDLDAL